MRNFRRETLLVGLLVLLLAIASFLQSKPDLGSAESPVITVHDDSHSIESPEV